MKARRALGVWCVFFFLGMVHAEDKVERYPDGLPKLKYRVNAEGQKHGSYTEYYESGKIKIKASYKNGELDGKYTEKDEKGSTVLRAEYKNGQLHGDYRLSEAKIAFPGQLVPAKKLLFIEGALAYPMPEKHVKKVLAKIAKGERKGYDGALTRLKGYRFICGVPYHDMVLDKELQDYAAAGAEICKAIGTIDHHPKNPGWPEESYKKAYYATSHSNLAMGHTSIVDCVDAWMYDSDAHNCKVVGHRRWCINMGMVKAGFGITGKFAAQMAHDNSRKEIPDWDFVCFPARGYMPLSFFRGISYHKEGYVWSISLNTKKYSLGKNATVKVFPLKGKKVERKKALELEFSLVNTGGYGHAPAVLFRPKGLVLKPKTAYFVEVTGVTVKQEDASPVRYVVEFTNL